MTLTMPRRTLRLLAVTFALLSAACLATQSWGRDINLKLIRWDGQPATVLELHGGKLWVAWHPRVPYRPRWAGQINRYGFRYNVYSDGAWYAWSPLWAPGVAFAAAALVTAYAGARCRRLRASNLCHDCGYDLRATPQRCPECGATARAASAA